MNHVTGKSLFDAWHGEVTSKTPPPTWASGDPVFEPFEIGPNRIILLGGTPGSGKTALTFPTKLNTRPHSSDATNGETGDHGPVKALAAASCS